MSLRFQIVDIATGQRFGAWEALARRLAEDTAKVIVITEVGSNKPLTEDELTKIMAEIDGDYKLPTSEMFPLDSAAVKSLLGGIKRNSFETSRPLLSWPFSSDKNPVKNATKMKHQPHRPLTSHISSGGAFFHK